ncbi:peptidase S1 domain protein [Metarhizium robertsii]|uniref:Peptidase S1/S6, chymotrypsin/Hap n=2 Tax=Metarhizium robertsii TaxID=568076 RepID=E9EP83_METRA|nr:Peptidase S1/S6, chymotrypsin/Hap [Metarhizium robertsii ARSEF 23]EFZ02093.1 Peptidase S1/S6, chymotrypsin/Hap [Metarhizium robertsii ARSEF 23]EXU98237.1 peptidase S1 domain protein [Metarhizium robertsii]
MFPFKATLTAAATILAFQTAVAVPVAGGVDAGIWEFPEAVGFAPSCGGTLLNANTVLTAAHCVISSIAYYKGTDLSKSSVIAGTIFPKDLQYATIVGISSFHVHPEYNRTGIREHDVAILKLSTDIAEDEWGTIRYARLPQWQSDPQPGSDTTVVGWGSTDTKGTKPTQLQKVVVPVVDRGTCSKMLGRVPESTFCAGYKDGGKDACGGDSGGPTYGPDGTVIGVTSYGGKCGATYGAYARVDIDLAFITRYM